MTKGSKAVNLSQKIVALGHQGLQCLRDLKIPSLLGTVIGNARINNSVLGGTRLWLKRWKQLSQLLCWLISYIPASKDHVSHQP
jgi:hypothetical protein